MKIQGSYVFEAPREQVWRALLDPGILARTLPGCEKLERVAENEFRGVLNVQVGPVKGQFQGSLLISDLKPAEGYHMKLDGKGPAGFMTGEGDLTLAGTGSATTLTYDLDSQVGGRIAGVGQRLLESSTKSITRLGLEGLAREIAAMPAVPPVAGPAIPVVADPIAPVAAPVLPPVQHLTQAEVAARVATDVARDMRPWLIGGALLLGVAVLVLIRACGS